MRVQDAGAYRHDGLCWIMRAKLNYPSFITSEIIKSQPFFPSQSLSVT